VSAPNVNVVRIELATPDPDRWVLEVSINVSKRMLAETPWWRPWKRRALLSHIGKLEDELREVAARADADALERTKRLVDESTTS
jgi:hypothetical protein